jgi:hypothetical protein
MYVMVSYSVFSSLVRLRLFQLSGLVLLDDLNVSAVLPTLMCLRR